jgi:dipeptidyl aminopeptidase/acylaminoacyl peptidase
LGRRTLQNLTEGSSGDFRRRGLPDGTRIAFSSDRDSPRTPQSTPGSAPFFIPLRTQVYVMARDGTDLQRLSSAADSAGGPSWSPDGKKVVYYERTATGSQIVSIDVANGSRGTFGDGVGAKSRAALGRQCGRDVGEPSTVFFPGRHAGAAARRDRARRGCAGRARRVPES